MVAKNKPNENITDLNQYAKKNLKTDRTGKKYVCPFCGSGNHTHKTSALTIAKNGRGFKCYACGRYGGVNAFKYYLTHEDAQELPENFKEYYSAPRKERQSKISPEQVAKNQEYIRRAQRVLANGDDKTQPAYAYLRERGYNLEQAQMLGIGFDPTCNNILHAPALVIPYPDTDGYFILRNVNAKSEMRYKNPPEELAGKEPVFNEGAFDTAKCIVIVEGPFDALALKTLEIEGVDIIPIIGAGGHERVITALKSRLDNDKTKRPPAICLMLDNDETGKRNQKKIAQKLDEMLVPNVAVDTTFIYDQYDCLCKDPDEMHSQDPDTLRELVEEARDNVLQNYDAILNRLKHETANLILKQAGAVDTNKTLHELKTGTGIPASIPTGIQGLDERLKGGLHTGLYVLCAGSSIGKTTLMLQIADYIASNKTPVLFYSIEQSARELISKSLSRLSYKQDETKTKKHAICNERILYANTDPLTSAKTTEEIFSALDNDTEEQLNKLVNTYKQAIQPYLTIIEPMTQPNANDIKKTAYALKNAYNKPPVVFIDYLQLLAPIHERDTERQIIDYNLRILRSEIARPLDTPVFIVSSIARAAYNTGIALESAKESGCIEFSADVFIGLQPYNLKANIAKVQKNAKDSTGKTPTKEDVAQNIYDNFRQSEERDYTITINKNRNGKTAPADKIKLKARADFAYFENA